MKKNIFVAMSSILVLGAALAGCGGGNTAQPADGQKPAENPQAAAPEKPVRKF